MNTHEPTVDVMASGVHDAKNVIFDARTRLGAARGSMLAGERDAALVLLDQAADALDLVARGLSLALAAYRLDRRENPVVLLPTVVADLLEEVALRGQRANPAAPIEMRVRCRFGGLWLLDRELIAESLVNALQNAQRFARTVVTLDADVVGDELNVRVEDDGSGFHAGHHDRAPRFSGVGLQVSGRVAHLHERNGRHGRVECFDGGSLGGAVFSLWLP